MIWRRVLRILVPRAATINAAGNFLVHAAPLFEEKSYELRCTLRSNLVDPLVLHRPRTGSGFTANDRPVYAIELYLPYRTDKRFERYETDLRRYATSRLIRCLYLPDSTDVPSHTLGSTGNPFSTIMRSILSGRFVRI